MICPACRKDSLIEKEIEKGLNAMSCPECRGKWIKFADYETWSKTHEDDLHITMTGTGETEVNFKTIELARLCPNCRRILLKFKVAENVSFTIDRCGVCSGIWLDGLEWEILKRRNLQDDLAAIFTDQWQTKVRHAESRQMIDKIYAGKFGEEYQRLKDFKVWIDKHEKKQEIIGFLRDPTPFDV